MTAKTTYRPGQSPAPQTFAMAGTTNHISGVPYDAAGNQLGWGNYTYSYDAFGMMKTFAGGGNGKTFIYTADDERLWELDYSLDPEHPRETFSVRDLDGKVLRLYTTSDPEAGPWQWVEDYVYRDGLLLSAVLPGESGPRQFHLDHLGTPRLATDSTGHGLGLHTYFPLGEELVPEQDTERMKFTGHERDHSLAGTTDDLDYMHARYCSPLTSRFLSPDPVSGDSHYPQTWNRYTYAANNPLSYLDQDGQTVESALGFISYYSDAIRHASDTVGGRVTPMEIARVVFQENRNDHNLIKNNDSWSWLSYLTFTAGGPEVKNQAAMLKFLMFGQDGSYGLGEMKASTAARLLGFENFDSLTPEQRRQVHEALIDPIASLVLIARHLDELKQQLPNSTTPKIMNAYNRGVANAGSMGEVAQRSGPYSSDIAGALAAGSGPKVVRCNGAFKFENQCQ